MLPLRIISQYSWKLSTYQRRLIFSGKVRRGFEELLLNTTRPRLSLVLSSDSIASLHFVFLTISICMVNQRFWDLSSWKTLPTFSAFMRFYGFIAFCVFNDFDLHGQPKILRPVQLANATNEKVFLSHDQL